MKLNEDARTVLADVGMTPAAWARVLGYSGATWGGDACGCPDSRCMNGFHHEPHQECGCLESLLTRYLNGDDSAFFAEDAPPLPVQRGDGRWYRPRKLTAEFVFEDDEESGILVFGTHNAAVARKLADGFAARHFGSSFRAGRQAGGGWWRDGFENGRRTWVTDEIKGRAAVLFTDIVEADDGE